MKTTYPILRLVTAPKRSARVLFDFQHPGDHEHPRTYPDDELTMGEPSLAGDAGAAGRVYGRREPSWGFVIWGDKPGARKVVARLSRELVRPRSWLMYQLDEKTGPTFFRTYATDPGPLSLKQVWNDKARRDVWLVDVRLEADAFGLGELVTHPVKALGNDPATGGVVYELPPILGDAPTPLKLSAIPAVSAGNWGARRLFMSLFSVIPDAVGAGPVLWDASTFGVPAGSGTGAVTADGSWFGPGYREVTFTDPTMISRLSTNAAPTSMPPLRPGRYLAFARVGVTNVDTVVDLQWGDTGKVARFKPPTGVAGFISWVPLGDFSTPRGVDLDVITIDDTAAARTGFLKAARVSGTGNLRVNGLLFVPVDMPGVESVTSLTTRSTNRPTNLQYRHVWDGEVGALWRAATGGVMESIDTIEHGEYPVAVPGERNVLTLLQQTESEDWPFALPEMSDSLTHTTQLTVSYHPWVLYVEGDQ